MFKLSILTEILIFSYSFQQFLYNILIQVSFHALFGVVTQSTVLKI